MVKHATQFVEAEDGVKYDFVCVLQPTCPLRASYDVDRAIEMLDQSDADAVVSLAQVEEPHPAKMMLRA